MLHALLEFGNFCMHMNEPTNNGLSMGDLRSKIGLQIAHVDFASYLKLNINNVLNLNSYPILFLYR